MKSDSSGRAIECITSQDRVVELCREAHREKRFGFDTEFVMEDRFEPEICLVQVAISDATVIIDPFLELDLAPVWELVTDPSVEVIVHAGQEDLAMCFQHTGVLPRKIFDVQIAAGFCGFSFPLSLQKLVQQVLHIRLHKTKTLTDWRKRPLSDAQISYAAEDVIHLHTLRDRLDRRLRSRQRESWAREEFMRFEDKGLYLRAEDEKLTRVKGAGVLRGRQLAILRELLAWREKLAARWNRPVRIVLKDHLMVEIAKHEICTMGEIVDLRGLNLSKRDLAELCAVVETGINTPEHDWPAREKRETESEREASMTALMTGVVRAYCAENDLAYGLAATKRSLRELMLHHSGGAGEREGIELLQGWRGKSVGQVLEDLLSGKRVLRVDHRTDGHHISLTER